MENEEKDWILSLPKDKNMGIALGLAKIFLDAPISNGGISTDEIKAVMDEAIDKLPHVN